MAVVGSQRVALVTGANKGIGFHIAQGLCRQLGKGSAVVVCSRDAARGEALVAELDTGGATAHLLQLDLTDQASVDAAAARLRSEFPSGLDIVVNNAGFAFKAAATEPFGQQARATLDVNYYGTLRVCEALFPLVKEGGRVVNVGSMAGGLSSWQPEMATRFLAPDLTVAQLSPLLETFVVAAAAGNNQASGWPNSAYGVSKAAVHALTRIHAAELRSRGISCNAMCPGWCKSDMAGWERPPKTAEEGADTAIFLAMLPAGDAPSGKFFSDRSLRRERGW